MFTFPTSHFLRDIQAHLDNKTRFPSDNYHPNSLIIKFSERKFLNDPNELNELTLGKFRQDSGPWSNIVKFRPLLQPIRLQETLGFRPLLIYKKIIKVLSNETIITTANFSLHKHFNNNVRQNSCSVLSAIASTLLEVDKRRTVLANC